MLQITSSGGSLMCRTKNGTLRNTNINHLPLICSFTIYYTAYLVLLKNYYCLLFDFFLAMSTATSPRFYFNPHFRLGHIQIQFQVQSICHFKTFERFHPPKTIQKTQLPPATPEINK